MSKQLALKSIFITLCLILSYIEMLIPFNFFIPGVKLGITNIVVLFALYKFGISFAITINIARILMVGLLFSNPYTMLYSLAGGVLSLFSMIIVRNIKSLSPVSVSVTGALFHNIGQILMASILLFSDKIILYLPVLMVSSLITGIITGIVGAMILDRIKIS